MKTWREKEGRTDIPESADNSQTRTQGRWPANVTHDSSDEVLAGFPVSKSCGHYTKSLVKPEVEIGDQIYKGGWTPPTREQKNIHAGEIGSAARFFYAAKASKRDRDEGLDDMELKQATGGGGGIGDYLDDVNSASGKYGSEKAPARNHHPTVKSTALMRWLCRMITPPGGVVLDPFLGSGSTGKAATLERFDFIGIELDAEYLEIARRRIDFAANPVQPPLFVAADIEPIAPPPEQYALEL